MNLLISGNIEDIKFRVVRSGFVTIGEYETKAEAVDAIHKDVTRTGAEEAAYRIDTVLTFVDTP
jgi:hypothetical protein